MSFLIRIQKNGESSERDVCSCPVLSDARFLAFVISKTRPESWVRIYREAHSVKKGRLDHDIFDGGILMTNDKVQTHVLLDDLTIPPLSLEGKVGVVDEIMSPPVNTMRRGKGRCKVAKKKKPTRRSSGRT